MDILINGKYSVLSNRYLNKIAIFCKKSVWDDGSDKENNYSSKNSNEDEGYDSDQYRAMYYKNA